MGRIEALDSIFMALRHLKKIRVVAAILVFVPATITFLDFGAILPARLAGFLARIQLVPSLLRGVEVPIALLPFVIVSLSALAFGRGYCSTLCPLGTLQDLVIRLSTIGRIRRKFKFAQSYARFHWGILGAIVLLAIGGTMLPLELTEPYSNFSRILSLLGRPLVVFVVNGAVALLEKAHIYAIAPLETSRSPGWIFALAWLLSIVVLAYAKGRLFCNLFCPAGAILRLLSRFSAFKIVVDEQLCTGCGLCEKICKARCIDSGEKKIDYATCVSCFNCFEACRAKALRYRLSTRRQEVDAPGVDTKRRDLLSHTIVLAGITALWGIARPARAIQGIRPITPPGSQNRDRFSSRCTACQLCVSVCPTQVLRPSLLEYGIGGLFRPRMVYDRAACAYDCNICGQVCPTGAILPVPLEEKRLIRIGRAHFVKNNCAVERRKAACRSCAEHCPTKAVRMVPVEEGVKIPEVNDALCIGCGACERACSAEPNKAIFVEACSPHETAMKLDGKEVINPIDDETDSPF